MVFSSKVWTVMNVTINMNQFTLHTHLQYFNQTKYTISNIYPIVEYNIDIIKIMLTQLFGRNMHMIAYLNHCLPLLFLLKYFFGQQLLLYVSTQNNFDTYKRTHPCGFFCEFEMIRQTIYLIRFNQIIIYTLTIYGWCLIHINIMV